VALDRDRYRRRDRRNGLGAQPTLPQPIGPAMTDVSTEVLQPGELSLNELADVANREHEQAQTAGAAMVAHAIAAGEALERARQRVPDGQWGQWIADHFHGSWSLASTYQRLYHYRDEVGDMASVNAARRHLKLVGAPVLYRPTPQNHYGRLRAEDKERAREMRERGATLLEIGDAFGVHLSTARRWVDPASAEKARRSGAKTKAKRMARERAAREQERQRAIKRAIRVRGGSYAELYAMAEKMQDVLGRAHGEATDHEVRAALARAGEHYRRMRDQIVRGLGVA
jgi:hypothetical protein